MTAASAHRPSSRRAVHPDPHRELPRRRDQGAIAVMYRGADLVFRKPECPGGVGPERREFFNGTNPSFRTQRRITAWLMAAIMLTLPFIKVHGESAFRFDIPSLKLYFFGAVIWVSEKYFFLLVFLLFLSGVLLFTVLYGRAWCGWVCPRTVLSDFTGKIDELSTKLNGRRFAGLASSQVVLLLLSLIVAANLIWYFVPPWEMAADLFKLNLGPWTFLSWAFLHLPHLSEHLVRAPEILRVDLSLREVCGRTLRRPDARAAAPCPRSLNVIRIHRRPVCLSALCTGADGFLDIPR